MKLGISPLLLLVLYISGIDLKEAKAVIYTTPFNYLSATQYLTLVLSVPKWFSQSWSRLLSFATHARHGRAQTDVSAFVDTVVWTSTFGCLLIWGVNTALGSGSYEPSLRSVHQPRIGNQNTLNIAPNWWPPWLAILRSDVHWSTVISLSVY